MSQNSLDLFSYSELFGEDFFWLLRGTFDPENEQPFDERQADQNPPPRKRKAKTKVHLSGWAIEFKERFKLLLKKTGADPRKIKEMVKECHEAVHEHLGFAKLNRNQQRSIDLYFRDFCQSQDVLLRNFETYLLYYRNNTYGNQS